MQAGDSMVEGVGGGGGGLGWGLGWGGEEGDDVSKRVPHAKTTVTYKLVPFLGRRRSLRLY